MTRSASIWRLLRTLLLTVPSSATTSCTCNLDLTTPYHSIRIPGSCLPRTVHPRSFRIPISCCPLTPSPADLVYPLPDSVDLVYGAMMEPLSVAVHAIANVGALRTGQSVLIFGAGPVGLLAMAVAKGLGASRIVAVDINEERLNFAKGYAATDVYVPVSPTYHLNVCHDMRLETLDVMDPVRETGLGKSMAAGGIIYGRGRAEIRGANSP